MKTILSILISAVCLSAFGAAADSQQATVTLPYSELLGLLERANPKEDKEANAPPKPPVDVLVQSATYSINCTDPDAATLDASFSVTNLSEEWQSVFLVEATEAIRSLDPPDVKIVQMDGGMRLLLEPKASATVTIGLQAEQLNYITFEGRESLELFARLLPRVKTATATVQTAEYHTDLVAEGGMLHKAEVTIEHADAAEYVLRLPEGGKLLSCSLNGRSVEPLLAESGGLIFALPKVSGSNSKSKVGYVFTTRGAKMNPVEGKAQLELPRTPLFIHRLTWVVQLPNEYQATALEGNVVIDAGDANGKTVRLIKQICDDETPFASFYYARKELQR